MFGLIGAALLYGDGMITPAISVLSAVEGLKIASGDFAPYTMPIAATMLLGLFLVQRLGTAAVGSAFGPLMLIWFVFIAVLGVIGIGKAPHVLVAIDPRYAAAFLVHHAGSSLAILGAVFLCVTGAEAMYADMGHFGRKPIRIAWSAVVLPALLLNYAGQTALLITNPGGSDNPFFKLVPAWALYPAVALSTIATVIASQAIITGSFSLTRQAMQLGWLPGMHIKQTSSEEFGQIYVPFVNWLMMIGTLALTIGFASSDRLAGAYGAAVSTTMLMTTAILYRIMRVSVAVAGLGRHRAVLAVHVRRFRLLRRQSHQDRRWRLDPAVVRPGDFRRDDDVARRHRRHAPAPGARRRARSGNSSANCAIIRSPAFPAGRFFSPGCRVLFRR